MLLAMLLHSYYCSSAVGMRRFHQNVYCAYMLEGSKFQKHSDYKNSFSKKNGLLGQGGDTKVSPSLTKFRFTTLSFKS